MNDKEVIPPVILSNNLSYCINKREIEQTLFLAIDYDRRQHLNWRTTMIKTYIINLATSALISYFENGYEYTQVIEGEEIFIVEQSPDEIVTNSFLYIGSSVEGAIESARLILKKKYMLPIGLSVYHNIFLIRCIAKRKSGTVWLVNSHIEDVVPDPTDERKAIAHTKHGHSLTIEINPEILQTKRTQASFLHSVLVERSHMNKSMTLLYDKEKGITFVKDSKQLNYTAQCKKEKTKDEKN